MTRSTDLMDKPDEYAAKGIQEYLIIDIRTPRSQDWRLIGYVLDKGQKSYRKITPDAEGVISFEHIGLRFVAVGRERVNVYDAETGKELLGLSAMKQFVDAVRRRADIEAERVDDLEKKLNAEALARKELEEELALLRAQMAKGNEL